MKVVMIFYHMCLYSVVVLNYMNVAFGGYLHSFDPLPLHSVWHRIS